ALGRRARIAAEHGARRRRRVDVTLLLEHADPVSPLAFGLRQGRVGGAKERVLRSYVTRRVERHADRNRDGNRGRRRAKIHDRGALRDGYSSFGRTLAYRRGAVGREIARPSRGGRLVVRAA